MPALVVAEPGGQYAAVDRGAGCPPMARRRAVANRQPALERGAQPVDRHRLCQIGVHAGGEAALLFAAHRIGRHRDDRRAGAAVLGLRRAQPARQLVAVHARHVQIGEHRRIAPGRPGRQRLAAVLGGIGGEAEEPELAHQHIAIDRMVVDHQQPRPLVTAGASQPSLPEIGGEGRACPGLDPGVKGAISAEAGAASRTKVTVKVEPSPGALSTATSPPISCASRRTIERPSPVPP